MAPPFHRAAYDGDGVRRKRDDSNGTVHYLGAYERKLAGGSESSDTVTKYYSASLGALSRSVAFRRGGTLHWVGSDHLGGTIRVLDGSFTALDGMRYKPYGEDRDTGSSLNTDRKFTGQTEDETAGLYWYASRAYDPDIGRFCSPDPIVPAPGNPQSLNRYSYVYNNPLGYVDPSGNSAEWFNQAWRDEFREVHKQDPDESDIAYRRASMEAASRGQYWSDKYWVSSNYSAPPPPAPAPAPNIQDHKANLAENYNPTIVLADQAREDHLAESYSSTIRPRDPIPVASTPSLFEMTTGQAKSFVFSVSENAAEMYFDTMGKNYRLPKETVSVLKTGVKRVAGPAGVAVGLFDTYSEVRTAGGSEARALFVAGGETLLTLGFAAAGTAMFGPVGTVAFGYVGNKIVTESGVVHTLADTIGL